MKNVLMFCLLFCVSCLYVCQSELPSSCLSDLVQSTAGRCCSPRTFVMIEFTLGFGCDVAHRLDQGIRFEVRKSIQENWEPIHFYTPTLYESDPSTVFLMRYSVLAEAFGFNSTFPYHYVNATTGSELKIKEYLCGDEYANDGVRLRWMQRYTAPSIANESTWWLDDVKISRWDGMQLTTIMENRFDGNSLSSDYAIRAGLVEVPECTSLNNPVLHFRPKSEQTVPRRSLVINGLALGCSDVTCPPRASVNGAESDCTVTNCGPDDIQCSLPLLSPVQCSACPPGFATGNDSYDVSCLDVDECEVGTHDCSGLAECLNTLGSFHCYCPPGYTLTSDNTCSDVALQFVIHPEDQRAIEGENVVEFQCSTSFTQMVTFVWEFTSIASGTAQVINATSTDKYSITSHQWSTRLSVNDVELSDAGTYKCIASADGKSMTTDAHLDVLFSPRQFIVSGNTTTMELQRVILTCHVSANPKPVVRWLKRTAEQIQVLTNSSRVLVTSNQEGNAFSYRSMVLIRSTLSINSGEYICEAENSVMMSALPIISPTIFVTVNETNDCLSVNGISPCKNGGLCTDIVNGYICTCHGNFQGPTCETQVMDDVMARPEINEPPMNATTELMSSVNFTCEAEGHPAPMYEWYLDDILLQGEHLPFLYVPEVAPSDRGSYYCKAINNEGETSSTPASLNIEGLYQYSTRVALNGTSDTDEILLLVLSRNLSSLSAFVHSVQIFNLSSISDSSVEESQIEILITVVRQNIELEEDSVQIVQRLREYLQSELQSIQLYLFADISRYDGCDPEVDERGTWPETDLGSRASAPCPCSEFAGSLAGRQYRLCEGSYSQKARWSDEVDVRECTALNDVKTTGLLCQIAQNTSIAAAQVAEIVVEVTSEPENLTAADVSVSVSIVGQLTDEAITDSQVQDSYLQIIDNIQQADRTEVRTSQNATNSSTMLLDSLGNFLDMVVLDENKTEVVFGYEKYALQVQDIDPVEFTGQRFIVDLGSVEEALNSKRITKNDLNITSLMSLVTNATASVTIQKSLINQTRHCRTEGLNSSQQRLSYSVFLSDILFQSFTLSQNKVANGSIIVSARLNCLESDVLDSPIQTTFRTHSQVSNKAGESECVCWNSKFGEWSTDDCVKTAMNGDAISCECYHLAHFGVLFDLSPRVIPDNFVLALSVFSYVGLVASLLCLAVFLLTYFSVRKLRSSIHGQILINLGLSLLSLYLFFLISGHVTSVPVLCGISSALLQYFLLVFFGWTAVEAVWLYLNLVKVFSIQSYTAKYVHKSAIPTWVVPVLIVLLSAGPGYKYYTSSYYCRATEWPFWFGTILPFLVIYVFNWIMFTIIMVSICRHTRNMNISRKEADGKLSLQSVKKNAVVAMSLAVVFGLGWAFGLAATIPVDELSFVFQALFCFAVGSQGLLIFLLHGVRNKDFRDFWIKTLNVVGRKTHFSSVVTSAKNALTVSHTLQRTTTDQHSSALDTLPKKKDLAKGVDCQEKSFVISESSVNSCSADDKDILGEAEM